MGIGDGGPIMRRWLSDVRFFLSIVWRPVHGDPGDSRLAAWWKYRLDARTAWEVTRILRGG
jgi:hypothetical protein